MGLLGAGGLVTRGDIFYKGTNILDISEKEKRKLCGAGGDGEIPAVQDL